MYNNLKNPNMFDYILVNDDQYTLISPFHFNDAKSSLKLLNHLIYEDRQNRIVSLNPWKDKWIFKEIFPDKTNFIKPPHAHFQQEYNKHFRKTL